MVLLCLAPALYLWLGRGVHDVQALFVIPPDLGVPRALAVLLGGKELSIPMMQVAQQSIFVIGQVPCTYSAAPLFRKRLI